MSACQSAGFPLFSLPEPMNNFVVSCSESLSASPELVAIPALVVAAASIGNARVISLKQDWQEPASLFAAVVSPSGSMKSPALQMATKPLERLETAERRTWTADVTVEQLAGLLAANPRGLLLLRDELSAWVKSMNAYKQGKGADRQFYLSVWGGSPVKVDRKTENLAITIERPCLSVVGCIPPDVVHDLDEKGEVDGFLSRLLFAWPNPVPVRWTEKVVAAEIRESYALRIKDLFNLSWEREPVALSLTPDAQSYFKEWHDAHCSETESPNLQPYLRAAYAKLKGYGPRLALIHALFARPAATQVEKSSMEAAISMIGYFKAQAQRIIPLLQQSGANTADRCMSEIKTKLSVCRSMKKRELQRNSAFAAEVFNDALTELMAPRIVEEEGGMLRLWEPTNRQARQPKPRGASAEASSPAEGGPHEGYMESSHLA